MFEYVFSEPQAFMLFFLFIIFLVVGYKTVKFVTKLIIVGIVSTLFPIFMYYLNIGGLSLNLNTILYFGALGISTYIIFLISQKVMDVVWFIGDKIIKLFNKSGKLISKQKQKTKQKEKDEVEIGEDVI